MPNGTELRNIFGGIEVVNGISPGLAAVVKVIYFSGSL